ncbi:MAG: heavy metal-binding domain-containing protein [Fibrobacteria bacterium]
MPSGIKPFAAVDLAPSVGQNANRPSAPPAPAASPFLGGNFTSAFLNREPPMAGAAKMPAPVASPAAKPASIFPQPALPEPVVDFVPAPLAPLDEPSTMPPLSPLTAARQSNIMSISDFNEVVNIRKPAFFCTTTPAVEGYPIQSYLGLVSVEVVVPKDILFQNPAAYGELHRMKAAEDLLQKVKTKAMEELSERARLLHADGVVGVSLHFSQFDAIVCLCSAVGTAVKLAD